MNKAHEMSFSKALYVALIIAAARASPVINSPSRVLPRGDEPEKPKPSTYPLGDACKHEWQYINFNIEDGADVERLEKLHDVICSGEMRAIASYGEVSAKDVLAPYKRYFPLKDEDEDYPLHVMDVLHLISGESSTDGKIGKIVETFVVDNKGESLTSAVGLFSALFVS